jgi:tetratricopeptide (TPR) repeat protein
MWQETIDSNLESARVAREHASKLHPGTVAFDALHAYDYLAYAWLQRGEDDKVKALVDELSKTKAINAENFAAYYALSAIPARYALERRNWSEAAGLSVIEGLPWQRYGYAEALTHFARAIGAARSGDAAAARTSLQRLGQLRQQLVDAKSAYWADQIDVQRRAAEGWIARAEGRNDEAVTSLQSAADLEDAMDKSPVTPGSLLPAREMLGDLYLELNQPAKALEAYERSLKDAPNRLNSLAGAARAASMTGDRAKERSYNVKLAGL